MMAGDDGGTDGGTDGGDGMTPTAEATLPTTGFAGSGGLVGAGLLALVLVAVVFVVRQARLN